MTYDLVVLLVVALVCAPFGTAAAIRGAHHYRHTRALDNIAKLELELGMRQPAALDPAVIDRELGLPLLYQTARTRPSGDTRPYGKQDHQRGTCLVMGCERKAIGNPYPRLCREHAEHIP